MKRLPKPLLISLLTAIGFVGIFLVIRSNPARMNEGTSSQKETFHEHKEFYTCGMHPQVLQDHPGICPICHMKLVPLNDEGEEPHSTESHRTSQTKRKVKYWWDPMLGPSSISDKPGKSAMGMELVPVYENVEQNSPAVRIDPRVVQNIGVRTASVTKGPLIRSIRAVGILTLPEPGLHDVSLKVSGWIEKLYADKEGMHIEKGDPLLELYSPELQVAEEELIAATKVTKILSQGKEGSTSRDNLLETSRQKLRFLDVSQVDIDALVKLTHAPKTTIFRSPATGHIEEKMVVQGSSVQSGMKLFRIADHSSLWLEVQVYEEDISLVSLGQEVEAVVDGLPNKTLKGPIIFIDPHVEHVSRTLKARIVLPNPQFELKPGMYAAAAIKAKIADDAIQVPTEAVIDTGERQFAFVAKGEGHFEPRNVRIGVSGENEQVQILEGLTPGEIVVTSGQFLLDVESRTKEAIEKLREAKNQSLAEEEVQ